MGPTVDSHVADVPRHRPPELFINSLRAHYDDEPLSRRSNSLQSGEEIPVRGTFIDFGCQTATPPDSPRTKISTAPARMGGLSFPDTFDQGQCDSPRPSSTVSSTRGSFASSSRISVTTDRSVLRDRDLDNAIATDDAIRGKA